MGFHGDLLELGWCTFREYFINILSTGSDPCQSYIYSVVYMASHDPENYRFSTATYYILYGTILTAYYM